MVSTAASASAAVPGNLRPGKNQNRPVSSTVGSGSSSSMSLYADARSQVGEDGRWNGSANGSVGGSSSVRGRERRGS